MPASPATDPLKVIADPALPKVCAPLVERARAHFEKADEIMERNPRRVVRAPRIMSKYYRAILELLVARGFAAPRAPVRLNKAAKYRHPSALRLHLMHERPLTSSALEFPACRPPCGSPMPVTRCMSTRPRNRPAAAAGPISTPRPISPSTTAIICCCRATATRVAYARSIGTEAGLVGPKRAQFPFVDLTTGQRWQLDLGDGRLPLWVFDEARRVPDTGLRDYLALMPLIWAGTGQTGRRDHSLRGHAVSAAGAAAAAGGAQCRSARGIGWACRRDRAGNAAGGRTGLPAADRARRLERGAGRAGDQAVAGQGRQRPVRA